MNILKLNVAVFSSLLFAVVDTAAGDDYVNGKLGKALTLDGSSHTVKIPALRRTQTGQGDHDLRVGKAETSHHGLVVARNL